MMQEHLTRLLDAVRAHPSVYGNLLRDPETTAAGLGIALSSRDVLALQQARSSRRLYAQEHDDWQGRTRKVCIIFAVLGALPPKRERKGPKAPRPTKPRK